MHVFSDQAREEELAQRLREIRDLRDAGAQRLKPELEQVKTIS